MSSLLALPDEVLKLVLQTVPVKHRLSSCCLVNKRLHAAAVAATQDLQLSFGEEPEQIRFAHEDSFLQWLPIYGQHLTRLALGKSQQPLQQLPCPALLELKLLSCAGGDDPYLDLDDLEDRRPCRVQLGAADGHPGVIQGCSNLTRLELQCDIIDAPKGAVIDSFSSLVHLQHLDVLVAKPSSAAGNEDPGVKLYRSGGLSSATLPRLQHLTHLLSCLSVDNLLQLGDLTRLQQLAFAVPPQQQQWVARAITFGPSSVPGLVFPASLTSLTICSEVDTGVLSLVPTGLSSLRLQCVIEGPAEGPGLLLSYMSGLQCLTQLSLNCWTGVNWPPPSAAYSALTASSNLADLGLRVPNLPKGVWPHIFPTARKLPHLTRLVLEQLDADVEDSVLWGTDDVCSLVSCCPNLHAIIDISPEYGRHVSQLHGLSALTSLHVRFPTIDSYADDFEESLEGLAVVTQLRSLHITMYGGGNGMTSFLPLTSLIALTHLEYTSRDEGYDDGNEVGVWQYMDFNLKTLTGCEPDVWQQLQEHIDKAYLDEDDYDIYEL